MKPETLNTLLAGHFVCQYAFPEAYADLSDPGEPERVDQWLQNIDRRLSRLGDDGAFFVAPLQVHTNEQVNKVKADLARFRDVYGLLVEMLNLVRLAKEGFRGVPGDYVQLADILIKVNEDTTLVSRLRELRIPGADARLSNNELLRKMLERLRNDGYLVLSNPSTETFQITGKVDHLHAVMQYLVENVPELTHNTLVDADLAEDDASDMQSDLIRAANSDQQADPGGRGVNEAPNLIQQLLKALADHSDLVSEAIKGPVSTGGKRNKGVDALIRMRALMPVDEDTYYLNPLLREFIGDYVVSYGAFRQLAQLDMPIRQLRLEFDNLREFRREGSVRDADRAMDRLDEAVVRIGFFMDQNLQMLSAKVTTNFGDVDSVAGKIRENKFYIEEVRRFSRQIVSLNAKVQEMEQEAVGLQLPEVRRLLNVRILSRLTDWTARIGDIQRVVSKNLFALRQIEQRQRNLANVALWLSKNRMSDGFELDVTPEAAERMVTPVGLVATWNVDVADNDIAVTQGILAAAKRLPPITITPKPDPIESPEVLNTAQAVVEPEVDPIDELIDAYVEHIRSLDHHDTEQPASLLEWRERFGEAFGLERNVTDEEWLLYACAQIASTGLQVEVVARPRTPGEYNDIFTDARACQQDSRSGALIS